MSFFDALLGLSTTNNSDAATGAANNGINATAGSNAQTLWNTTTNAGDYLRQGRDAGRGQINAYYGGARNDLTGNNQLARDALMGGVNGAVDSLRGASANFQPWMQNGQNANGMLSNALGLNGAGGNAAATGAFQAGPGYQFQLNQATDNAARKAASLGMAGSGNTLDAITRLSSNLANNEYGSWMDRLNGLSTQGLSAANSMNQNAGQIANIQAQGGAGVAGLFDKLGSSLGNLGVQQGNVNAGLDTNYFGGIAGLQTQMGRDMVANNWHGTDAIAGNMINQGKAQDSAENRNNGIFSNLFSGAANGFLSGLKL